MDRIGISLRMITRFHAPQTCSACGGSGGAHVIETSGGKTLHSWKPCHACGGSGQR